MSNNYQAFIERLTPFFPEDYQFPTPRQQPQPLSSFIPTTSHPRYLLPSPSYVPYNPPPISPPVHPYQEPVGYADQVAQESFEYEQMLEIQEQLGRVNLGLSKETISKNLKTGRIVHVLPKFNKEDEGEKCAICQDEYKVNQNIGILQCGHTYHGNCIKLWLLQQNVCLICRATALVV